jgi:hypothetical protein
MGIFGKSDESAVDVLKEYNVRIKSFLEEIEGGPSLNPFRRREEPLDDLLSFCHSALEALARQNHRLGRAHGRIQDLNENIEHLKERLMVLVSERDDLRMKVRDSEEEQLQRISMLTLEHQHEVNKMNTKFNSISQKMKEKESNLIKDHGAEKDKLIAQLFASHSDTKEWPDEKLKLKYRELQRLIESLAVMKAFRLQPGDKLPSKWDSNNFLGRTTVKGITHFLFRSVIWKILMESYFSAPFGFGALGSGVGKQELIRCYSAWLQLIKGETVSGKQVIGENDLTDC